MKEFTIKNGDSTVTMNLPTKLSEITKDYLLQVTNEIQPAPYYCVVAMVYRWQLGLITSAAKKKKDLSTAVVPIYVKSNLPEDASAETKELFNKMMCGDKIIIGSTSLELGNHLSCPKNFITIDNIVRIYNADNDFAKGTIYDRNYYYFVDFKLVAASEIRGFYAKQPNNGFVNPFIIDNSKDSN